MLIVLLLFVLAAVLAGPVFLKVLLLLAAGFLLFHVLFLLVLYLAALKVKPSVPLEKQEPLCRWGCGAIIGLLCAYCGIRPHINGREKLPTDSRFLLVCNHRSMFDPLVIMDRLRSYNISFISKPSNLKLPVIGRIAYGAGFLPIDRENNREALKTIIQAAGYLKNGLCSMAVYPEGTRSRTEELLPFHPGCFKVAQRAGVPLVISAVRGTEKVKKRLLFGQTHVYLDIIEVLPADKVKAMSTKELSDYSRELMEKSIAGGAEDE